MSIKGNLRLVSVILFALTLANTSANSVLAQEATALSADELTEVNQGILGHLEAIREIAPDLIDNSRYEFKTEDELERLTKLMTAIREDLKVNGQLRNLLQLQIANTKDIIQEVENDPNLNPEDRESFIETFEGNLKDLTEVRSTMDRLADEMRKFTDEYAPGLKSFAKFKRLEDKNAEVTRTYKALGEQLKLVLKQVDPEAGGGD